MHKIRLLTAARSKVISSPTEVIATKSECCGDTVIQLVFERK